MKKLWQEFKKFISRGNVVDMAVGVAVAGAFTKIVSAFTAGFVTPLIALLSNNSDFKELKWIIREEQANELTGEVTVTEVALLWGAFLQAIIDFLIIALTFFIVLKIFNAAVARAKKMQDELRDGLTPQKIKEQEAAEAAAAAEKAAAEQAAAEAAAAEAAQKAAAEKEMILAASRAQVEATESTAKLLTEIRDLLKEQSK